MMYKEKNISTFQFVSLAFISRIVFAFTGIPNLRATLSLTDRIAVLSLGLLLSLLSAIPVFLCGGKQGNIGLQTRLNPQTSVTGRCILLFYTLFFIASTVLTVTQFSLFASNVLLQKTNLHLFVAVLIACGVFCAYKGIEPMARVGVLLAVATLASLLFIALSNTDKIQPDNLAWQTENRFTTVLREAFFEAGMNAELTVLLFLAPQIKITKKIKLLLWLPLCAVILAASFTLLQAIAGNFADLQLFPLHTLTVLTKTKLFERIDDLIAGLWVACTIIKTGLLLFTANITACSVLPAGRTTLFRIGTGIVIFGGYLFLSDDVQRYANVMQSTAVPILFLSATVIIPLFVFLSDRIKQQKRRKGVKR